MAELIKCIECGGRVSTKAHYCPHCHSLDYKGSKCRICRKIDRKINLPIAPFIHKACFNEISQYQYSCPICKTLTTTLMSSCIKCGHPVSLAECYYCHQTLITDASVKLPAKKRRGYGYDTDCNDFAHKICYANHQSSSFFSRHLWSLFKLASC